MPRAIYSSRGVEEPGNIRRQQGRFYNLGSRQRAGQAWTYREAGFFCARSAHPIRNGNFGTITPHVLVLCHGGEIRRSLLLQGPYGCYSISHVRVPKPLGEFA